MKLKVGAGGTAIPGPYTPHLDALIKAFRVAIAAGTRPEFDPWVRIVEPVGRPNAQQLGRLKIAIQTGTANHGTRATGLGGNQPARLGKEILSLHLVYGQLGQLGRALGGGQQVPA